MSANNNKTVLTIESGCHRRIKTEAARHGVKIHELAGAVFDYTLPLLESGKLTLPNSSISLAITPARKAAKRKEGAQ